MGNAASIQSGSAIKKTIAEIKKHFIGAEFSWIDEDVMSLGVVQDQDVKETCWAYVAMKCLEFLLHHEGKLKEFQPSLQEVMERVPICHPIDGIKCKRVKTGCGNEASNGFKYMEKRGVYDIEAYFTGDLRGASRMKRVVKKKRKVFTTSHRWIKDVEDPDFQNTLRKLVRDRPLAANILCLDKLELLNEYDGVYVETSEERAKVEKVRKERLDVVEKSKMNDKAPNVIYHAVYIVGYGGEGDDKYFLTMNTWGDEWDFGGFGRVKAEYIVAAGYPEGLVFKDDCSDDWWEEIQKKHLIKDSEDEMKRKRDRREMERTKAEEERKREEERYDKRVKIGLRKKRR